MIKILSTADSELTLTFLGEDIEIKPGENKVASREAADFVLKTLGFCSEVAEDKKEEKASVPAPKVEEKKEEVKEDKKDEKKSKK